MFTGSSYTRWESVVSALRSVALVLFCGLVALPSAAIGADGLLSIERYKRHYDVQPDGRFSVVTEVTVSAISSKSNVVVFWPTAYSESTQTLEILDAKWRLKDGALIDVPKEAISTHVGRLEGVVTGGSKDWRTLLVAVPLSDKGKLELRTRLTQVQPLLMNKVALYDQLKSTVVAKDVEVVVRAPAEVKLRFESRGYAPQSEVSIGNGKTEHRWTLRQLEPRVAELSELADSEYAPYWAASNLETWAELSGLERPPQVSPDEKVLLRRLVHSIIGSSSTDEDKIARLHNWINSEVRYEDSWREGTGRVAKSPLLTATGKQGDCRDVSYLFVAMLGLAGIDAEVALINAASRYWFPKRPTWHAFDHMIVYLTAQRRFIEVTPTGHHWSVLPKNLAGKMALLVRSGKLLETPQSAIGQNSRRILTDAELSKDGAVSGTVTVTATGESAATMRAVVSYVRRRHKEQWAKDLFPGLAHAEASMSSTDTPLLEEPLTVQFKFSGQISTPLLEGRNVALRLPFFKYSIGAEELPVPLQSTRRNSFMCSSSVAEDVLTLRLPPAYTEGELPAPVMHRDKTVAYQSTYSWRDGSLRIARTVGRARNKQWCEAQMWEESERLEAVITKDARVPLMMTYRALN